MSDPENRALLSPTSETDRLLSSEEIYESVLDLVISELRILVEKIQALWVDYGNAEPTGRTEIACRLYGENEKLQRIYECLSKAEKRYIQSLDPNFYQALDLEADVMKPHLSKVLGYTQP